MGNYPYGPSRSCYRLAEPHITMEIWRNAKKKEPIRCGGLIGMSGEYTRPRVRQEETYDYFLTESM